MISSAETQPSSSPVSAGGKGLGRGKATDALRARVRGTNINEQTLLATDFLNHFNEIVMTLEMVPDMPELMEEAKAWRPKTYQDHFRDSVFAEKDLAIEAYRHAPAKYRRALETTIVQMSRLIAIAVKRAEARQTKPTRCATASSGAARGKRNRRGARRPPHRLPSPAGPHGPRLGDHQRQRVDHGPSRDRPAPGDVARYPFSWNCAVATPTQPSPFKGEGWVGGIGPTQLSRIRRYQAAEKPFVRLPFLRDAALRAAPQDEESSIINRLNLMLRRPEGPSRSIGHRYGPFSAPC